MSLTELLLLLGREACRPLDEELEERGVGDPSARVVLAQCCDIVADLGGGDVFVGEGIDELLGSCLRQPSLLGRELQAQAIEVHQTPKVDATPPLGDGSYPAHGLGEERGIAGLLPTLPSMEEG